MLFEEQLTTLTLRACVRAFVHNNARADPMNASDVETRNNRCVYNDVLEHGFIACVVVEWWGHFLLSSFDMELKSSFILTVYKT